MNGMKSPHPIFIVLATLFGVVISVLMTNEIRYTLIGFIFGLLMAPLIAWYAYALGMQKAVDWLSDLQDTTRRSVIIEQRMADRAPQRTSERAPVPLAALPAPVPNYMGPRSEMPTQPIPVTTVTDSDSDIPLIVG